eukprot:642562-Rhodomonas_salina.1
MHLTLVPALTVRYATSVQVFGVLYATSVSDVAYVSTCRAVSCCSTGHDIARAQADSVAYLDEVLVDRVAVLYDLHSHHFPAHAMLNPSHVPCTS